MKHDIFTMTAIALAAFGLQAARADNLVATVPTVHVTVSPLESQAQLAQTLRAEGYSDVVLADSAPTFTAPHPELNAERTANPQSTPVRAGWNGVAVKDGRTVEVYAGF